MSITIPMAALHCTSHSILNDAHLIAVFRKELESGKASDLHTVHFVLGGVHLGDDDVIVRGEVFAQLIPDGGQLLAVSTPRSI